ncbi:insulinase family protein, partial [Candidatus Sumerlaeota bacterium]|nr:insulinase family protein [Candidatus Sumerlaeota bacterium]
MMACVIAAVSCKPARVNEVPFSNRQQFALAKSTTRKVGNVTVHTLQNGMTLLHEQKTTNAIVGGVMYIRVGASAEDSDKAGMTNLMMRLLTKGTTSRSADEIAERLAALGASLAPSAGRDFCKVSFQCVNDDFADVVGLFADVVRNPTFPTNEVALEKKKVLAGIRMGDDLNHVVGSKRFMKQLFGSHPYSRPLEGDAQTIATLNPADLVTLHADTFAPSNMVLSVVGNISFDEARSIVEKNLGEAALARRPAYSVDKVIAPGGSSTQVEKKSEQTFIAMGHLTCATGDRDEAAVEVATTVLGGGMSSRLFVELRDKQGLAYSVGASATFLKQQGYFIAHIGTTPANVKRATDGLWAQIDRLRMEPLDEEELQNAKNYIAGEFLRDHERNLQQASYLGYWFVTGRPPNHDAEYLKQINAVTSRDVMRVANKYFLDPTVVTVGPRQP